MKREYKAKAEGYKQLMITGIFLSGLGLLGSVFLPYLIVFFIFGIFAFLVGLMGYAYYSGKYEALTRTQCRFCGAEIPEGIKFCPRCGKSQV